MNNKDIFCENINKQTLQNNNYRKVIYTGKHMQLVYMNIKPQDNIHLETHEEHDQFIRIEQGTGIAILNNKKYELSDDFAIIIPAGTQHEIINTSKTQELKLYTIYSPPEHPKNTINFENPDNLKHLEHIIKVKYC